MAGDIVLDDISDRARTRPTPGKGCASTGMTPQPNAGLRDGISIESHSGSPSPASRPKPDAATAVTVTSVHNAPWASVSGSRRIRSRSSDSGATSCGLRTLSGAEKTCGRPPSGTARPRPAPRGPDPAFFFTGSASHAHPANGASAHHAHRSMHAVPRHRASLASGDRDPASDARIRDRRRRHDGRPQAPRRPRSARIPTEAGQALHAAGLH